MVAYVILSRAYVSAIVARVPIIWSGSYLTIKATAMLSGHPGISPWVASPRGPKERDNIRGWTVKIVTIAKSDRSTLPSTPSLGDLVKTFLIRKPLHQGWLRRLPLYQWKGYRNGNIASLQAPLWLWHQVASYC